MAIYATLSDLVAAATFYGVVLPMGNTRERLLELASADVDEHLGARWDPLLVTPAQAAALRDATAAQALFRHAQGSDRALGLDDGLASVGPLSFSLRQPPRLSPEAEALLVGQGLFMKSSTVPTTFVV